MRKFWNRLWGSDGPPPTPPPDALAWLPDAVQRLTRRQAVDVAGLGTFEVREVWRANRQCPGITFTPAEAFAELPGLPERVRRTPPRQRHPAPRLLRPGPDESPLGPDAPAARLVHVEHRPDGRMVDFGDSWGKKRFAVVHEPRSAALVAEVRGDAAAFVVDSTVFSMTNRVNGIVTRRRIAWEPTAPVGDDLRVFVLAAGPAATPVVDISHAPCGANTCFTAVVDGEVYTLEASFTDRWTLETVTGPN